MMTINSIAADAANLSQSIGMAQASSMGLGNTEAQALGITDMMNSFTSNAYNLSLGQSTVPEFAIYNSIGALGNSAMQQAISSLGSTSSGSGSLNDYGQLTKEVMGSVFG